MSCTDPLAKKADNQGITLTVHLQQVTNYARAIADAYYPHWQHILGDDWATQIRQGLVLAALTHDLGKATEGFQKSLHSRKHRWEFRHEVLSAALLLAAADPDNETIALAVAAILTHHRDLNDSQLANDAGRVAIPDLLPNARRKFYDKAKELMTHWLWLRDFWTQSDPLRQLPFPDSPDCLPLPADFLQQLIKMLSDSCLPNNHKAVAFLLTRGCLMAADHAVSAGVTVFKTSLPSPAVPPLRPFQKQICQWTGDAFLEAPTGSGKTIAALLWALRNRQNGDRIFYLLPYQASIEAMADTLTEKFGDEYVGVLHARALDYAFREYFEETGEYEIAYARAKSEVDLNRLVHKPIKVATPFQLLKWLFGMPRFEIGVSEMVGGLFIFDEIHAYDPHIVALIVEMVKLLKKWNGRFLFMSATFPPFLKKLLQDALGTTAAEFSLCSEDADQWTRTFLSCVRHRLRWHDKSLEDLLPAMIQAAEQGNRVLVVANRVAQAQEIYRQLRNHLDGVRLLHSRFIRRDRVHKEKEIIEALQNKRQIDLRILVATQVVEVSLDVSFDTIFTEIAPVDDLLQRLGRVNRYGEHPNGVDVHIARLFAREQLRWVYELHRVSLTLDYAPGDDTPLTVAAATDWVNKVYEAGWTQKETERFDQSKKAFQCVLQSLRPLYHVSEGREEFYGLVQSVEVLPRQLYPEYDCYLTNKHYLLASQLVVPIPLSTFHMLKKAGRLKLLKNGVLMADAPYDYELGLLPTEVDSDVVII
ncbi:MAG: CRISPR-associated helicase Cas3' [Armatimonadetes bacterium]|nr:CRISPR-associated helicase Cas3' [Armatimonadota bacterium]MDW8121937.1 CRISPR-associated helicase Cas3' [Armatimonadota bacterium]